MIALIADSLSRQLDALPHRVTVNETELIMVTWKILSNYRTHGLAYAVRIQQRFYRRALGLQAHVARRMALVQVRTALVQAINSGEFHG